MDLGAERKQSAQMPRLPRFDDPGVTQARLLGEARHPAGT
jgi:hypothetical protein